VIAGLALLTAAGLYAASGEAPVEVHETASVEIPAPAPAPAEATQAVAPVVASAPEAAAPAKEEPAKPAASTNGTVTLNVMPWANVTVDGVEKGPTPPLKKLSLPEGQHQIKIENPNFPERVVTITVAANKTATLRHDFANSH